MSSPDAAWPVPTHRPLRAVAEGVWTVDAELSSLPIGRRMAVMRRDDGSLAVHSAVCADAATMTAIDALGAISLIIVPNGYHRLDAPRFTSRYPAAAVVAPGASLKRVRERVPTARALAPTDGAGRLSFELLDGCAKEAVWLARDSAGRVTLVFNDLLMNLPAKLPGFKGWLFGVLGSTGGPKVTRTARLLVSDKHALAAHYRRLADLPGLTSLVPAHGAVIEADAPAVLRRVADALAPQR